jgi:hypothetical protein
MMSRFAVIALSLLVFGLTRATAAETPSASVSTCDLKSAVSVPLERLAGDPNRWKGACVSITGWQQSRTLLDTRAAAETWREGIVSSASLLPEAVHVGVYGDNAGAGPWPRKVRVIGRLGLCEDLRSGDVFVSGYCHYRPGPYIELISEPLAIAE